MNKRSHTTRLAQRSRRRFLSGTLSAGIGAIGLAGVLRAQAATAAPKNDHAVIHIWLGGGPSQFETYDPKPAAPVEIRGSYGEIPTSLPGLRICDALPLHARIMHKAAVLRSVNLATNNHILGAHWCATGYFESQTRNLTHPSAGSLVSKLRGANRRGVPPYVLLSQPQERNLDIGAVHNAGYLGIAHRPFTIKADASRKDFHIENLQLADDITLDRLDDRRWLLEKFDRLQRSADDAAAGMDRFNRLALEMVTGTRARKAFDLSREDARVRQRYGTHRWGQAALLARRLVEAGVPFVTINTAPDSLCWDWHLNLKHDHRPADGSLGPSRGMDVSGPHLDRMVATLVEDVYQRGLDKKVLILVWGEFGRTPRINKTGGRDHWGAVMSVLLAGGGLRVGQVVGASNSKGEVPVARPLSPGDVLATVYRHLGISRDAFTVNNTGRPVPLLPEGEVIDELV